VAHFLTQCLFCFFAEDVGLLPGRMFERLLGNKQATPERLGQGLTQLFGAMRDGGLYGVDDIPWFNGGLFQTIAVPPLSAPDLAELRRAADLDWSAIDVSIFGTLFERGLDPAKRSQLGAHYTDPATIERLIDPVIRRPLLQKWELVAQQIRALAAKITKKGDKHYRAAHALFVTWLDELKNYRALDPACGSGNFLYLALKCLKDVEHHSHLQATELGLDREADLVTGPHNVLGIELNEYAAELARVTVWIGELQWRLAHGYEFKTNPVLDTLEHIECRDALLTEGGGEAAWPAADVVVGNPPFLGGSKKRGELGDGYFDALNRVYDGHVPGGADLVCYWFHKAHQHITQGQLQRAGLVTTQAIRAGSNRKVLDAICSDSRIFDAWSDEPWVNEGAAVRVSLVCFGNAEQGAQLNGLSLTSINADLTGGDGADLTRATVLAENADASFKGAERNGAFDIPGETAREWLKRPNPNGKSNAVVIAPWRNGQSIAGRESDSWIVDFGVALSVDESSLFEAPFSHVVANVKPERDKNNREAYKKYWWRFGEPRPAMRLALEPIPRYIVTPRVAKHRYFVWFHKAVSPDSRLFVIARADDTTFGILSSRVHELWSLAQASIHGDGSDGGRPTYNAKSCFETFPFPAGLTPADTAHQRTEALEGGALIPADLPDTLAAENSKPNQPPAPVHQAQAATKTIAPRPAAMAIAQAVQRLNTLRQAWLNPPEWTDTVPEVVPLGMAASPYPDRTVPKPGFEKDLSKRTLTNLYNQRPAWLAAAHAQLDAAVAAAYGWADYTADMPDDEILRRLLALNLERSGSAANN
jgi:methylase of polypeptide subunit release factors